MTSVLEEFHSIKSDFQDIVCQVESLRSEQQEFLKNIQTELQIAAAASSSRESPSDPKTTN